jgi:hypothetical protein
MSRARTNKADYKAEDYKGQAKELETLQDAAPIEVVESPAVQAAPAPVQNLGQFVQDATRPEEDPMMSPLAGIEDSSSRFAAAPDADMILQAMYKVLPSKEIAALLKNL